ncbi:putative Calcium/calmodulin-dependent protein kinase kinase [Blattamonas nauphoetae]|uniref:Calcium/calmodulin-dependent protein kinase kinase n=1 Tax=Blattamonas nauphoetae TaxID=2049346 RepID=A0ABQ9YGA9_9EUKA|nr:putative Calcium/calmodulin-dependent protein kinase kinase [Blattamonas nauphoetae]
MGSSASKRVVTVPKTPPPVSPQPQPTPPTPPPQIDIIDEPTVPIDIPATLLTDPPPEDIQTVQGSPEDKNVQHRVPTISKAHTRKLQNGMKMVNNYVLKRTIGRGSFGKVVLCEDYITHERFAMKIYDKQSLMKKKKGGVSALDKLQHEVDIMKRLDHPSILSLHSIISDPTMPKLFLIMELAEGGSILTADTETTPLPQQLVRSHARQLIAAVHYLHRKRVVHRDIKPENLLLSSSGQLKVGDFGVAVTVKHSSQLLTQTDGTYAFMAPEVLSSRDYRGYPTDMWAIGVTLYQFLCGSLPFLGDSDFDLIKTICNDPVIFPDEAKKSSEKELKQNHGVGRHIFVQATQRDSPSPEPYEEDEDEEQEPTIPRTFKHLVRSLLEKNPVKRLTAAEAVVHPFLTDGFRKALSEKEIEEGLFSGTNRFMINKMNDWRKEMREKRMKEWERQRKMKLERDEERRAQKQLRKAGKHEPTLPTTDKDEGPPKTPPSLMTPPNTPTPNEFSFTVPIMDPDTLAEASPHTSYRTAAEIGDPTTPIQLDESPMIVSTDTNMEEDENWVGKGVMEEKEEGALKEALTPQKDRKKEDIFEDDEDSGSSTSSGELDVFDVRLSEEEQIVLFEEWKRDYRRMLREQHKQKLAKERREREKEREKENETKLYHPTFSSDEEDFNVPRRVKRTRSNSPPSIEEHLHKLRPKKTRSNSPSSIDEHLPKVRVKKTRSLSRSSTDEPPQKSRRKEKTRSSSPSNVDESHPKPRKRERKNESDDEWQAEGVERTITSPRLGRRTTVVIGTSSADPGDEVITTPVTPLDIVEMGEVDRRMMMSSCSPNSDRDNSNSSGSLGVSDLSASSQSLNSNFPLSLTSFGTIMPTLSTPNPTSPLSIPTASAQSVAATVFSNQMGPGPTTVPQHTLSSLPLHPFLLQGTNTPTPTDPSASKRLTPQIVSTRRQINMIQRRRPNKKRAVPTLFVGTGGNGESTVDADSDESDQDESEEQTETEDGTCTDSEPNTQEQASQDETEEFEEKSKEYSSNDETGSDWESRMNMAMFDDGDESEVSGMFSALLLDAGPVLTDSISSSDSESEEESEDEESSEETSSPLTELYSITNAEAIMSESDGTSRSHAEHGLVQPFNSKSLQSSPGFESSHPPKIALLAAADKSDITHSTRGSLSQSDRTDSGDGTVQNRKRRRRELSEEKSHSYFTGNTSPRNHSQSTSPGVARRIRQGIINNPTEKHRLSRHRTAVDGRTSPSSLQVTNLQSAQHTLRSHYDYSDPSFTHGHSFQGILPPSSHRRSSFHGNNIGSMLHSQSQSPNPLMLSAPLVASTITPPTTPLPYMTDFTAATLPPTLTPNLSPPIGSSYAFAIPLATGTVTSSNPSSPPPSAERPKPKVKRTGSFDSSNITQIEGEELLERKKKKADKAKVTALYNALLISEGRESERLKYAPSHIHLTINEDEQVKKERERRKKAAKKQKRKLEANKASTKQADATPRHRANLSPVRSPLSKRHTPLSGSSTSPPTTPRRHTRSTPKRKKDRKGRDDKHERRTEDTRRKKSAPRELFPLTSGVKIESFDSRIFQDGVDESQLAFLGFTGTGWARQTEPAPVDVRRRNSRRDYDEEATKVRNHQSGEKRKAEERRKVKQKQNEELSVTMQRLLGEQLIISSDILNTDHEVKKKARRVEDGG